MWNLPYSLHNKFYGLIMRAWPYWIWNLVALDFSVELQSYNHLQKHYLIAVLKDVSKKSSGSLDEPSTLLRSKLIWVVADSLAAASASKSPSGSQLSSSSSPM